LSANNLGEGVKGHLTDLKVKGELTQPIAVNAGYVIYRVEDYHPASVVTFEDIKDQVRANYLQDEALKQYAATVELMTNTAYEQPDSLTKVAELVGEPVQYTGYVTRQGAKEGIVSNPSVISAAFSDDVLVGSNNSEVIKLQEGKAVVLRVAEHKASADKPLAEVRDLIIKQLTEKSVFKKAEVNAASVKAALKEKSIPDVAKAFSLDFTHEKAVGRFSELSTDGVLQLAFSLPVSGVGSVYLGDGKFAVVKVEAIADHDGVTEDASKQEAMYRKMLTNEWSQALVETYGNAIVSDAKIKPNKALLERI